MTITMNISNEISCNGNTYFIFCRLTEIIAERTKDEKIITHSTNIYNLLLRATTIRREFSNLHRILINIWNGKSAYGWSLFQLK